MEKEKTASLPETEKQQTKVTQPASSVQVSQGSLVPEKQCNQQRCQVSKLSDTATLHLYEDAGVAQASHQKRIAPFVESNGAL